MSRADFYFITNLHLMYNKQTLIEMNGIEGSSIEKALKQKHFIEKQRIENKTDQTNQDKDFYGSMIDLLEKLFHSFSGGGLTLERLKNIIRGKVKCITPR